MIVTALAKGITKELMNTLSVVLSPNQSLVSRIEKAAPEARQLVRAVLDYLADTEPLMTHWEATLLAIDMDAIEEPAKSGQSCVACGRMVMTKKSGPLEGFTCECGYSDIWVATNPIPFTEDF